MEAFSHTGRKSPYLRRIHSLPKRESHVQNNTSKPSSWSKTSFSEPESFVAMVQKSLDYSRKIQENKNAPSGIRTRVSRLGSVNANHYTNSASNWFHSISITESYLTIYPYSTFLTMGSGAKTKGKRQAGASKRYTKRMRSLKMRSKDLDRIQVLMSPPE